MELGRRPGLVALTLTLVLTLASVEALAQTEDVVWTSVVGASVTGNSLSKTTGTGWGNSGASSIQGLESTGFVEFTATETSTWRMLGLSRGDANQTYQDIDFGLGVWVQWEFSAVFWVG